MSIYPTVRPSLTLDFQKSKQLDPRITFSRTQATGKASYVQGGVIKYADEHQARFEDKGLLVEESRANILLQSSDFTTYWYKYFVTIDPNVETAPDGTTTASKMQWSSSNNRNCVFVQPVTDVTKTYTCSFFTKAAEWNFAAVAIQAPGGNSPRYWATFDLTTGDVEEYSQASPTETSYKIDKLSNGWWRVSITANVDKAGATKVQMEVGMSPNNTFGSSVSGTPDGTSGIYIWGAQEEQGSFPTSYIPTAGTSLTRAQELVEITGDNFSSWWNSSEGSIVTVADNFPSNGNRKAWEFNDGTHVASGPTLIKSVTFFQSPVAGNYTNSTINFGSIKTKTAFTFTTNAFIAGSGDGSDTLTNTSGLDPNVVKVVIGKGRGGYSEVLNGTIARIHYYPTQVSNEQLEALTS